MSSSIIPVAAFACAVVVVRAVQTRAARCDSKSGGNGKASSDAAKDQDEDDEVRSIVV
jgi:hypothetical protein